MDTFAVLEQLKLAIQRDFDVLQQKQSEVVSENNRLLESNGHLNEDNAQLKHGHESLTQRIGGLQNDLAIKNEQLQTCKRKLEKLRKKELWWDQYFEATELRIGMLTKHGSFPENVREWLEKDVNDIITLIKNATVIPNQKVIKKHSMKLSTSKSNKRTRYSNMSPPGQHARVVRDHSGVVREHSGVVRDHSGVVREHSGVVREHSGVMREHSGVVREHSGVMREHSGVVREHSREVREQSSGVVSSTRNSGQELHLRKDDIIIINNKEKENVQLKSSKLDISNNESKKDRKNKRNNSSQVLKAKENQPVIDVDVHETENINLSGEENVNCQIGPPSLASTPVFSTDNQHFFAAETQFDETMAMGLENAELLALPDNYEIQIRNDLSGIPSLSPTVQSKLRSVSPDLAAVPCDESVSVIPQQESGKGQNDRKNRNYHCGNNKDTIMPVKQFRHLQDSKYSETDVNCKAVENSSSEYDEYGTTLKYPSRNFHTTCVGQPDSSTSLRLVSEPGNRRKAPGASRAADGPRQSTLRQSTLRQHIQQESGPGASPCKRKRSLSGSDVEYNSVKQLQEKETIYVVESPKQEKPLFKVPAPPSQLLSLSITSPSNQVTVDDMAEMETSCIDLFGDLGTSNAENSNIEKGNENEDIDETCDEGEKVSPVDKAKESDTIEFAQPLPSKSETMAPAPADLDDDFDEEGRYQEYLRQRKEPEAPYKYQEVVRKKDERAKLNGYSCRDCDRYFNSLSLTDKEKRNRMKQCSRHRAKFSPPPNTPEGFWNLSFIETQEYMEKGYMRSETAAPPPRRTNKPRRARRKLQQ